MAAKVRKCSWKLLEKACQHIVSSIDDWTNALDVPYIPDLKIRSSVNIDEVIGVARGGLIPATMLSHMLKKDRVYTIGTKLYTEQLATDFSIYSIRYTPAFFRTKLQYILSKLKHLLVILKYCTGCQNNRKFSKCFKDFKVGPE